MGRVPFPIEGEGESGMPVERARSPRFCRARHLAAHAPFRLLDWAGLRPVVEQAGCRMDGGSRCGGPTVQRDALLGRDLEDKQLRELCTHVFIGACPAEGTGDCRISLGRDTRNLGLPRPMRRPLFPR